MIPRPQTAEAAPYYFTYINRVTGDDPLAALENQLEESQGLFSAISEENRCTATRPINGASGRC